MKNRGNKHILIMAGGTGGHVYPALATARCLQSEGYQVEWLGTRRGIEARLVPEAGIRLNCLSVTGLRGKRLAVLLKAPFLLPLAMLQSMQVCRRFRPACVLGMGGFASGPGGLSAWLLRIPLVIQEQNAVPGTTNRILARFARTVLEGFAGAFGSPGARFTGNPVRDEITGIAAPARRGLGQRLPLRVLVVGGSLGATVLNETVPAALAHLSEAVRPEVWHQTGRANHEVTVEQYHRHGIEARIEAYVDDMATAYGWADAVICRAGALTVSELAVVGLPSVLVPYPHAIDDHQTRNAQWLCERGAAIMMPQTRFTAEALADQLTAWHGDPAVLLTMAEQARACARPDAGQRVAAACKEAADA